jgi:hypothetical protein
MFKRMFAAFIMTLAASAAVAQEETTTTTNDPIVTENTTTSTVTTTSDSTNTVITAPPTAISPNINTANSDLCTVGVSGAVQTQILGISAGSTVRDMNCEKLKNAKTLYDMGMKVAAVSVMCQDGRIFQAMMDAGTPCPIDGKIGEEAKSEWNDPSNQSRRPDSQPGIGMNIDPDTRTTLIGGALVLGILAVLLGGG